MNKIDFKAGTKLVSFRKKSLFIDDDEFLYSKITNIRHSASKHIFVFEYDGQVYHFEKYDPRLEKTIIELFARINMIGKSAKAAASAAEAASPSAPEADKSKPEVISSDADTLTGTPSAEAASAVPAEEEDEEETIFSIPVRDTFENPDDSTTASGTADAEEAAAAETDGSISSSDESSDAPDAAAADEAAPAEQAETDASDKADDTDKKGKKSKKEKKNKKEKKEKKPKEKKEKDEASKEKSKKLKKSFIVYAAIIVVIGLLTAGYFYFFGTSDNPNAGPNSNSSQNYDDIDQLIDDLDN